MIKYQNREYKIIDAHLHLPWQNKYSTIEKKSTALQNEMKRNGVDYGILIADSILDSNIGNNEQCLKVVNESNNLFLVFGFSPIERIDEQLRFAEVLLKEKKTVGIKLYPEHEDFGINDIRINDVRNLCIKYKVPLVVHTEWNDECYPQYSHPFFVKQLAENNPDLNIVCSHIWNPRVIKSFKLTEKLPNIFYDVSSFCMGAQFYLNNPETPFPNKEKAIEYLQHITGICPERVMFGSDYGALSMKEHIELVLDVKLDESKTYEVFYENANKIFKLDL